MRYVSDGYNIASPMIRADEWATFNVCKRCKACRWYDSSIDKDCNQHYTTNAYMIYHICA